MSGKGRERELLDSPQDVVREREVGLHIRAARLRAALSVNRELILLYWQIGRAVLERQAREGWGAKVIERLGEDLRREFPDMRGLSRANLFYMRSFAEAYQVEKIVQQLAGQLPWYHNVVILTKVNDPALREWYMWACIEHGWSRAVLEAQIETRLHERSGIELLSQRCMFAVKSSLMNSELVQSGRG